MKISILMLTFNAPRCVLESVKGVNKAKEKTNNLELIVLDNNSQFQTKNLFAQAAFRNIRRRGKCGILSTWRDSFPRP